MVRKYLNPIYNGKENCIKTGLLKIVLKLNLQPIDYAANILKFQSNLETNHEEKLLEFSEYMATMQLLIELLEPIPHHIEKSDANNVKMNRLDRSDSINEYMNFEMNVHIKNYVTEHTELQIRSKSILLKRADEMMFIETSCHRLYTDMTQSRPCLKDMLHHGYHHYVMHYNPMDLMHDSNNNNLLLFTYEFTLWFS